jgi:hypothetical protein
MNEELLIEILRFGAEFGKYNKTYEIVDYLKKRGIEKRENDIELKNYLEIYFDSNSQYIKPEGFITLFQYEQLQKTRELADAAQKQAEAAQKEAKHSNTLAYIALFVAIASTFLSIYLSYLQLIDTRGANEYAKLSIKIAEKQFEFDKQQASKPNNDSIYLNKLDEIIKNQEQILKTTK